MSDYSAIDRLLHRLVLGNKVVGELLFDLECSLHSRSQNTHSQYASPVIVTGLARAGTTILMRALYSSGEFASLTYDDMPFVMSPSLWQKISSKNKKRRITGERAHGDRILVNSDSPEALEEVFWRSFNAKNYIFNDALVGHEFGEELCEKYKTYQLLICDKYNKKRYLAKNNNHILRLPSLAKCCPEMIILIVFRDPLQHANSLLNQHRKFNNSDSFTKSYMEWLVHHEFGSTHKPFCFTNSDRSEVCEWETGSINYWLVQWIRVYAHILMVLEMDNKEHNIIPVSYERLCNETEYWKTLCTTLNVESGAWSGFVSEKKSIDETIDSGLLTEAKAIYKKLEIALFIT